MLRWGRATPSTLGIIHYDWGRDDGGLGGLDVALACPKGCGDVNWAAWSKGKGAVGYAQTVGLELKVGPYPAAWYSKTLSVAVGPVAVAFNAAWNNSSRPDAALVAFARQWAPRIAHADWKS